LIEQRLDGEARCEAVIAFRFGGAKGKGYATDCRIGVWSAND
jgi:hypothetical protein